MDKTLTRIIRILLDELDKQADQQSHIEALEAWKEQVEAVWPEVKDGAS